MRIRQGMTIGVAGAALLVAAMPANASITVERWLARYDALLARDRLTPVAADDPEMQLLFLEEAVGAFKAVRKAYDADVASGRKPFACLPPPGDPAATVDSNQIVDLLRAVPVADRGETVDEAVFAFARVHWPCPAAASGGDTKHE